MHSFVIGVLINHDNLLWVKEVLEQSYAYYPTKVLL